MPTLSGRQVKKLSEGLRDSFSVDSLEEFLFVMFDRRLADITLGSNYRTRVFDVIKTADSEGWVLRLISAACEARPSNPLLQEAAAEVGLGSAPSDFSGLERIILESAPFVDVSTWRARLGELEAQVCRIEVPVGPGLVSGTGFLVAPDICLTNFHVVEVLINNMADPSRVRLRFDYKRDAGGTVVDEGTVFELADDWLVAARPPSFVDGLADPSGRLPASDELDFALLRVRNCPGRQAIGRTDGLSESPQRGWIRRVGIEGFDVKDPLFILQHPDDSPLVLAFGQSDGLNANATRLRHQVNTRRGSSGAPCLNVQLELIGLHHAGDPNFDASHKPTYNVAVPITAIRKYLAAIGLEEMIFSA